jgi:hypothetical protein
MDDLWRYHKPENWQYFLSNVVPLEFEKNKSFYEEIKKGDFFPDDVYQVLAVLSDHMFNKKLARYESWLKSNIPALNGKTPLEIIHHPHGLEWLKEYLLRYPW